MSPLLRIVLAIGAVIALGVIVSQVKRGKIRIADSIFWVLSATVLVIVAIFPGIAFFFSNLLGFLSPSNFVFVIIIALMLLKIFSLSCALSRQTNRIDELSQEIALHNKEDLD
jgi:hypothetical protein